MRLMLAIMLAVLVIPVATVADEGIKTVKVNDHLYMLVSPQGGNVLVSSGEDGVFIVDDQLDGHSEAVKAAITAISGGDIQFVLNTHYHFDHTGGNEYFGKEGSIIIAHDNVRKRLSSKQVITYFKKEMPALGKDGLPVVTLEDKLTLHYNGDDVRAIHVPNAHTDGDVIAHFTQQNVLMAGDIIFNEMYPFIDVEHGGTAKGVIAALDVLIGLADKDTVIVPGHGKLMNLEEVKNYRSMLATIAKKVEIGIKAGKMLAAIQADKPTKEFDAYASKTFINPDAFVEIVYNSIARQYLSH